MKQRVLLPAIVFGVIAAVVLAAARAAFEPAAGTASLLLDAAIVILTLAAYGLLMRQATAPATLDAGTTATAAPRAAKAASAGAPAPQRGARNADDGGRGNRSGRGRGGSRGGRGGAENSERDGRGSRRRGGGRERSEDRSDAPKAAPKGPREEGRIKWFSGTKGYGFVIREDGTEIFVHHRALDDGGRRDIPDGQPVSFVVVERDKGPQADALRILAERESAA